MIYYFNLADIIQMKALKLQLYSQYSANDAKMLDAIISKAIANKYICKEDAAELIKILPRIIPVSVEQTEYFEEESEVMWFDRINEEKERFKHEMEKLRLMLSQWLFMNSAVYQQKTNKSENKRNRKFNKITYSKHK